MGGISGVATIDPARADDAHRRLYFLHRSYLHWRRVGSENDVVFDIKRVFGISGRMFRRDVQRFEVVVSLFDFRTIFNRVAHGDEDVLDFLARNAERVPMSDPATVSGQSDIESLAFPRGGLFRLGNSPLRFIENALDFCLQLDR